MLKKTIVIGVMAIVCFEAATSKAANTLPVRYSDAEFWRMVTAFSEPGGAFPYENFVSNEVSYQDVIPELKRIAKPGGAYLGVAPEQNFTYIAAIRPKVAFIMDIRRQNMLELLMYKALFEMSADRVEFVSKLFSRPKPSGLTSTASAEDIFRAFEPVSGNSDVAKQTLQAIKDRLRKQHQFQLSMDDEQKIEYVFNVFFRGGPRMDYSYASSSPNNQVPSYYNLMVATDGRGTNWAYLETEERYRYVRDMQLKNLIVPLVADFGGSKTIKTIAQYLKDHRSGGFRVLHFKRGRLPQHIVGQLSGESRRIANGRFDSSHPLRSGFEYVAGLDQRRSGTLARTVLALNGRISHGTLIVAYLPAASRTMISQVTGPSIFSGCFCRSVVPYMMDLT